MKKACIVLVLAVSLTAVLLSGCTQPTTEDLTASIPSLTVWTGDGSTESPTYGYSWSYEPRFGSGQAVVADVAHPLQVVDDLTRIPVSAGSTLGLEFSLFPDSVTVTCWTADQAGDPTAEGESLESSFSNGQFLFTVPESGQDLVLMVRGHWTSYSDVSGSVGYAFVLSQS